MKALSAMIASSRSAVSGFVSTYQIQRLVDQPLPFFSGLGVQDFADQLVVGVYDKIVHVRHIAHTEHTATPGLLHFFHSTHKLGLRYNKRGSAAIHGLHLNGVPFVLGHLFNFAL